MSPYRRSPLRGPSSGDELRIRVAKLERINQALMTHVERATDQHEGAYSLFQTAILLEGRVRARTGELTALMLSLERSNEALKAARDEAERANRSKTRFLAAASHDLLQPLNAARLSSSALAGLQVSGDARILADQVERGLQTIEDLIKTLLDISKLDAGVVLPVKKPARLRTVIAGIEEGFRGLAERKGLRFVIRCPDLTVETDVALLQRIIQNLVSNALRYATRGGVLIAARRRGTTCLVEIVDTGPGIPEPERDLVFEEFYRGKKAQASESGLGPGLGLGLAIVRRMASALDHGLSFRSRVGHGTAFRIAVPLTECPVDESVAGWVGDISLAAARVLIIENDPATRAALTRLLQSWSLEVAAFSGPAEWQARHVKGEAPDLLIADYHLDDGDIGLDVVAEIRAATHEALPVIVVTADHSESVEALVLGAGCHLMRKPVRPAQLRSLLSYLIQASVPVSPGA